VTGDADLPIVPGVAAGEGCSTAGGCATCPFMKMNTLDALIDVLGRVRGDDPTLAAFEPRKYAERLGGETVAAVGSQPILHMRAFQASGRLPDALIADIRGRAAS
jgi:quinolinate synthase